MIKKLCIIAMSIMTIATTRGMSVEAPVVEEPVEVVIVHSEECNHFPVYNARYYPSCNEVRMTNGNVYIYDTDEVSGDFPYDGMPVHVGMCDQCSNDVKDHVVLGLVYDHETAIYDELYDSLSENEDWTLTRTGNHIHIDVEEE